MYEIIEMDKNIAVDTAPNNLSVLRAVTLTSRSNIRLFRLTCGLHLTTLRSHDCECVCALSVRVLCVWFSLALMCIERCVRSTFIKNHMQLHRFTTGQNMCQRIVVTEPTHKNSMPFFVYSVFSVRSYNSCACVRAIFTQQNNVYVEHGR